MNVVLCTIIVVITSNLIRKITLNMLCSVPCCEVQQIVFPGSPMGRRWAIRSLNFKEVSYESGNLHNHHCDNLEPNSKDNSEYSVLCSLLRGSNFFFLLLSMGRRWAFRTLNVNQVSYERSTLHNHCSDNLEPNSKDNSEYDLLCSLLRGSPDFFFLALHCNAFSYHNFEIERSQYCTWYVPRTPNSSFYFPKASCNCWKRFSAYTFPRVIFNLRTS